MSLDWARLRATKLVYSDNAVLALNKPSGITVTGERHDTDIVTAAAAEGERLYPVHRIDKVTSGLILFATDLSAHGELTRQFNKQTAQKSYLAIVQDPERRLPDAGSIDLPLSVGRKNRVRVAAHRADIRRTGDRWFLAPQDVFDEKNYPARTDFTLRHRHRDLAVLHLHPRTGRRHQIRVHVAWIGTPIVGDPLFDRTDTWSRTALHSWRLELAASWLPSGRLDLSAAPGPDFWEPVGGETLV